MTTADGKIARKGFMLGLTYTSPESDREWKHSLIMGDFQDYYEPLLSEETDKILKENLRDKAERDRFYIKSEDPKAEEQRLLQKENIKQQQQRRVQQLFQIYKDNYYKGRDIADTVIATKQTPEEKGVAIDKAFDDFLSDRNSNLDGGRRRRRTRKTRRTRRRRV
jgi:hypothetical protein